MKRILIGKLAYDDCQPGGARVMATVGGEPLWFESSQAPLRLAPEGYGSALLVPAMCHGRDLVFEDPVCPVWLANVHEVMGYFSSWWGWKPINIEADTREARQPGSPGKLTALCFSGGVDSFFSLLTYPRPIDTLVFIHGYDIHLEDEDGARLAFDNVQRVAAEMRLNATLVRSNYRKHPIAGKKYRYAYGGAIAAVGHLLDQVGELVVSSGMPQSESFPNGSHWQTDPLWSSSDMTVNYFGAGSTKNDKIGAIAAHPLAQRHLRICQENFYGSFALSGQYLNCGQCQKCVRTLLVLEQEGKLDDFVNFANKKHLDACLDRVMQVDPVFIRAYDEIRRRGVRPETQRAIRALIRRRRVLNRMEWAGRRGRKAVFQVLRLMDALERKCFYRQSS